MHLILPSIKIQGANALAGGYAVGYPSMTAFLGLANAICRGFVTEATAPRRVKSLSILHHTAHFRSYGKNNELMTHKRAVYQDAAPASKHSLNFTPATELQPQVDLTVTLLIDVDAPANMLSKAMIEPESLLDLVPQRALGGVVESAQTPFFSNNPINALKRVRSGWFLVDQTPLLTADPDIDALEALFNHLTTSDYRLRYTALHTGYRAISDFAHRSGQRDPDVEHAFAETILGLGRFVRGFEKTKTLGDFQTTFWNPSLNRETGIFALKGAI